MRRGKYEVMQSSSETFYPAYQETFGDRIKLPSRSFGAQGTGNKTVGAAFCGKFIHQITKMDIADSAVNCSCTGYPGQNTQSSVQLDNSAEKQDSCPTGTCSSDEPAVILFFRLSIAVRPFSVICIHLSYFLF